MKTYANVAIQQTIRGKGELKLDEERREIRINLLITLMLLLFIISLFAGNAYSVYERPSASGESGVLYRYWGTNWNELGHVALCPFIENTSEKP